MPMINVQMLKGRSQDQKRALAQAMTDAIVTHCKVAAEQVWIVIDEVNRENWAVAGQLYSDK
ncbi:MAG TPA: 2-hydroxymuconate tautomerase [Chloroflexota bacterium]|nr:2-hydroxymuconate tautomerase [Chloroflexota bacterium]